MKNFHFIFLLILVTLISCKKTTLPSSLNVKLGYTFTDSIFLHNVVFPDNQDTIKFNSADSTLLIQIVEDNFTNKALSNQDWRDQTEINNVTIKTSQDEEVFVNKKNAIVIGGGYGAPQYHHTQYYVYDFVLSVSIKFTSSIIKNDNIIELNSPIDVINLSYVSKLTNNTIEKQFVIKAVNN